MFTLLNGGHTNVVNKCVGVNHLTREKADVIPTFITHTYSEIIESDEILSMIHLHLSPLAFFY